MRGDRVRVKLETIPKVVGFLGNPQGRESRRVPRWIELAYYGLCLGIVATPPPCSFDAKQLLFTLLLDSLTSPTYYCLAFVLSFSLHTSAEA